MPYNVFVVDDEPMIRYGLISCIKWQEEGLHLLGEAGNGEAALKKLQAQQVDILITDIKMPLMDGLELIRHVKERNPDIQVILISSYSDFEYAREAVKLGVVVDYLLKPTMEPEDLLGLLRICRTKLEDRQQREVESKSFSDQVYKTKLRKLEAELKAMLGKAENKLTWTPDWFGGALTAAYWRLDHYSAEFAQEAALDKLLQLEAVMEKLTGWNEECVNLLIDSNAFMMLAPDREGLGRGLIEEGQRRLLQQLGISFTVGISPAFHHLQTLHDAKEWAMLACDEAFFEGQGKCYMGKIQSGSRKKIFYASIGDGAREEENAFPGLKEQFSKAFAEADQKLSEAILQKVYSLWESRRFKKDEIVSQAKSLLTMLWSREYRLNAEQLMKDIVVQLQEMERIETLHTLKHYIQKEFDKHWTLQQVNVMADDSGSAHIIQLALAYIQENYRSEMTLQKVADYVHMSKNYFSEQFKRRTGLNYIDFVIKLRIRYAKQLLVTTSLRIQEIGDQSGFNSPKHFLKLFKRETGCTPAEYRERKHAQVRHGQQRNAQMQGAEGDVDDVS